MNNENNTAGLCTEEVSHFFGDVQSLDCITTQIGNGSIFGLIGSNGSGKSTLLRILSGIYHPVSGRVLCDGIPTYENPQLKRQIVYLSDEPYFLPNASMNDMAAFYRGVYPAFDDARFAELAGTFGLDRTRRLSGFSRGMKKQAAISLVLAARPRWLLFDETFDGLDPQMRRIFCSMLAEASVDGVTSIVASHSLRELEDICDHVALLHRGQLLLDCDLDDLKETTHRVQAIFRTEPDLTPLAPTGLSRRASLYTFTVQSSESDLRAALDAMHPEFYELIPLTLEEIFINEMEEHGYDADALNE